MLMTVVMHDAKEYFAQRQVQLSEGLLIHDLMYADDTLLIDADEDVVEAYMQCVGAAGAEYGLSFNWRKIDALPVRTSARIRKPDGTDIMTKDPMKYLGSMLSADGRIGSELGRRIGLAKADFEALRRVWAHASLSRHRKLEVFNSCVISKLLHGLFTATMNKVEHRRVDGFQARCLRQILRIAPAYYSRVSNKTVLDRAQQTSLTDMLQSQRARYMTELFLRPPDDPFRNIIFKTDGSIREISGKRRVGRPRMRWIQLASNNW